VLGARGMAGSAVVRALHARGEEVLGPTHAELELLDQEAVREYLRKERPDVIVLTAARVGGIWANMTYPAQFLYENLMIAANVIQAAHEADVDRLLYLGSSCIYPSQAAQPIPESALLSGPLEPTNEAYAVAKIAGVKLCQAYRDQYGRDYIAAMPTNLYGPGDNYHTENSHVFAALLRRFHEAADEVVVWGTGRAKREFLYVEDLAEACLFLLDHYHGREPVNVGSEEEVTIAELARLIGREVGFRGEIRFDTSKPDGVGRKKTDTSKLANLGWVAKTALESGIALTYAQYKRSQSLHLAEA
jgi:GDP-L-fucose synthase